MRRFPFIAAAVALALLGAYPAHADSENQFFGTITGAALGGIVGNQFGHGAGRGVATATGVIAGGWIGNDVGYSLDNNRATPAASSGGPRILPSGDITVPAGVYRPNYVAPDDQ